MFFKSSRELTQLFRGRALSFQLINATDGGPAFTWSSIAQSSDFQNGDIPLPILVADSRAPGTVIVGSNSTVFEFNPFELGSFDPTTYGFAPLDYVGSNFSAGVLTNECISGFDNAGFVMGTSSSLFNALLMQLNIEDIPQVLRDGIAAVLQRTDLNDIGIANYAPNPFFHWNNQTNEHALSQSLALVDGGEDLQNIPLHPLIQPFRAVDVIFAVDASADTTLHWPNGSALIATYERSLHASVSNGTSFPAIPDVNTFINLGLNIRPTFFGCDASNTTKPSPLIVYIPNAPYIIQSNFSTLQIQYNDTDRNLLIENGYNMATQGNGTLDKGWGVCVACAVISRSLTKTGTAMPDACNSCFSKYCWDGRLNTTVPSTPAPTIIISHEGVSGTSKQRPALGLAYLGVALIGGYALL
jgi:lysophospholipase